MRGPVRRQRAAFSRYAGRLPDKVFRLPRPLALDPWQQIIILRRNAVHGTVPTGQGLGRLRGTPFRRAQEVAGELQEMVTPHLDLVHFQGIEPDDVAAVHVAGRGLRHPRPVVYADVFGAGIFGGDGSPSIEPPPADD